MNKGSMVSSVAEFFIVAMKKTVSLPDPKARMELGCDKGSHDRCQARGYIKVPEKDQPFKKVAPAHEKVMRFLSQVLWEAAENIEAH